MKRWIAPVAVVVLVAVGVFLWLRRPPPDPTPYGLERVDITFESELVDREVHQIAIVPSGDPAGLVVLMHGRGSSPESMLSQEMFSALEELGDDAPVMLLVDGGESSYFHDRSDGDWATYVVEEAIPTAADRLGLDADRVAIGGMSMGGFGALNLARLYPGRWCGVGAHSPAIFESFAESAGGAFDDADDFARHDLFAALEEDPEAFQDVPIRIDVGADDPFASADRDFAAALQDAGAVVFFVEKPGAHDEDYWWSQMSAYLDFYAASLARCR